MGIKKYIESKKNKQKDKDILEIIKETIYALDVYLDDLEKGIAHPNVSELSGEELEFAQGMIANEKRYVRNTIESLHTAHNQIQYHKIINDIVPAPEDTEEEKSI